METKEILIVQTDKVDFSHLIKELSELYSVRVREPQDLCGECVEKATLVITPDYDLLDNYKCRNVILDKGDDYTTVKNVAIFFKLNDLSLNVSQLCKYFK